ncbi:hypothetical protein D3C71_2057370 [compost metagenome]
MELPLVFATVALNVNAVPYVEAASVAPETIKVDDVGIRSTTTGMELELPATWVRLPP